MIDLTKLEWGLQPFKTGNYLAVFGARTIWDGNKITFLPDRQQFTGNSEASGVLCNWINNKALPKLKQYITDHHWTGATREIYTDETWQYRIEVSPNGSHGYLYFSVYMKGFDEFPAGKWSGNFIPKIGETVFAVVNDIGKCQILGYYLEDGWIGVIAKPAQPPEWFVRQNGENAVCGLFGTEIRKLESEHQKGDNE